MKLKLPKRTEQIAITDQGQVFSGKAPKPGEQIRHFDTKYKLVSDKTVDGERVIKLKKIDPKAARKKREELVQALLDGLGETKSKALKAIILDSLEDFYDESIDNFHDMVVNQKQPVKAKEGCFKIVIGDARKKGHKEIMLRN